MTYAILGIRGLFGGIFSKGIDKILSPYRDDADFFEVVSWNTAEDEFETLAREQFQRLAGHNGPIFILIHSFGWRAAYKYIPEYLADKNVYLFSLDPARIYFDGITPLVSPLDESRHLNIWQTANFPQDFGPVENAENVEWEEPGHSALDDREGVRLLIRQRIDAIIASPGASEPPTGPIQWVGNTFDREKYFAAVRQSLFGGSMTQGQVDGQTRLLDMWEQYCRDWDMRELAYDLGTCFLETGATMQPIFEIGSVSYFDRYDPVHNPSKAAELGNTQPGDGYRYRGAGDVQQTGRANARKSSARLNELFNVGANFEEEPDTRVNPELSALCLFIGNHEGWWTGRRLPNYAGYGHWDMKGARTVVNGHDRWQEIGTHAGHFLEALKSAAQQGGVWQPPTVPDDPQPPTIPSPGDLTDYLLVRYPKQDANSRERAAMLADAIAFRMIPNGNQSFGKANHMFAQTFNPKSKTFWTGAVTALAGLAVLIFPETNPIVGIVQSVFGDANPGTLISIGLGMIFGREAIAKNGQGK